MSGLPGTGKTTIAHQLAVGFECAVISVDTIERGLQEAGIDPAQPTGPAAYAVASRLVDVQLSLGLSVIVDAVNNDPHHRQAWLGLAHAHGADVSVVMVVCSDEELHRQRLTARRRERWASSWEQVLELRETWTPWPIETETIDTATAQVNDPRRG